MSLMSWWLRSGVCFAAVTVLLVSAVGSDRRLLARAIAGTAAVVAVVAVWFRIADPVHSGFPPSFFLWGATPVLALGLAIGRWRRSNWRHRLLGVIAVPVCLVFAALTINAHYAYYPTLSALQGAKARDQVTARTAARIADQAHTTATLPAHGVVQSMAVPATHSGFHARGMFVYLPPAWFATPRPALPVVMLIAGSPGTPADWTRSASADVLMDEFAAAHEGRGPILVMPDVNGSPFADTECVDGPRGNAETYVVDDVRPYVIDHFGAAAAGTSWAVGGLSEGGTCALVLALRHSTLFGSFVDLGGQAAPTVGSDDLQHLYGGNRAALEAHRPSHLLDHQRYPELGGWFENGTGDRGAQAAARLLAPLVAASGAPTCVVERGGIHNFTFWHEALRDALPWVTARIGLTTDAFDDACRRAGGRVAQPPSSTPPRP